MKSLSDHNARSITLGVVVIVSVARVVLAASVGLGDVEAYYWVWSRHLDWAYFDHGPLVAWTIAASTALFGSSTFGVRALFILLSAGTLVMLAALAQKVSQYSWRSALAATLALLCLPMFLVAGAAANPDGPLLFCLAAFLLLAHRAHDARPRGLWFLIAAGLVGGLAASAKLFGLLLLPALLVVAWRQGRRALALLSGLLAFVLGVAPVLIWNVSTSWASLRYHLVERHHSALGISVANVGKLVGGQLAYVGPLPLVGLLWALFWLRREDFPGRRVFLWVSLPLLLAGATLILVVPSAEPHWPAAGYVPLLAVLGHMLVERWRASRWIRRCSLIGAGLSGLLFVAFHFHVLTDLGVRIMPASYIPRYDLANELVGWDRVASRAFEAGRTSSRAGVPLVVGGCHYTSCSQLRFAARGRFTVVCPSPRRDQFDFLPGGDGSARRGVDLLYVYDERFPFETSLLYRCSTVRALETIEIRRGGRVVRRFALNLCTDFAGLRAGRWPPVVKGRGKKE